MARAVDRICREATDAVLDEYNILILSDRAVSPTRIPIPALLATAAVHHHLIRRGLRTSTGLVVETGEAREVHHFCVLAGYGAEAINPYLAFETLEQIRVAERADAEAVRGAEELPEGDRQGHSEGDVQDGHLHLSVLLRRADLRRGRTVQRLRREMLHRHRHARSKAPACDEIAREAVQRHRNAYRRQPALSTGCWTPAATMRSGCAARIMPGRRNSVAKLQHAARGNSPEELPRLHAARSTTRASGC